jgi:hypothetical protein
MKRAEIGGILALWGAAIAFIRPIGEFPLLDDWGYAMDTWSFAKNGHFHFTPFTSASLRAMVLWGAAWTRLFGQSFLVLRLSTITLGAIAIVLVHRILLRAGVAPAGRVIGTLAFAFHPIFLWSSCTYMTEVPFVCASIAAFYLIWRGIEEQRDALIVAGGAMALVACFVRQTGIVILAAAILVAFPRRRRSAVILGAFVCIFGVIWVLRPEWLAGSLEEFAAHYKMWSESSFRLPQQIETFYRYAVFNAQNSALFFLPLVIAAAFRRLRLPEAVLAAVILFRVQQLVNRGIPMPYFAWAPGDDILQGNILIDFGLGPPTLTDVWSLRHPYPFHLAYGARLLLTYGSVVAAAVMIPALRHRFATTLAVVGTLALAASGFYTDRYSLDSAWSVGIALAVIAPWEKRAARAASTVTLAAMAVWGTFSVQEYFAWQRARWTAYESLRARGIPAEQIDGGSEPINWYERSKMTRQQARRSIMFRPARDYVLTFAPLNGYRVIGRVPFEGWLGWHRGAILTGTSGSAAPGPCCPPASAPASALRAASPPGH